ncbi:unnamed protein product [Prorocentrum cordatum]|nr:unnamed protein product [Polarella glacialis]
MAVLGWKGSYRSPSSKDLQDTPSASWREWSHPKEFSVVTPGFGSLGATIRNQGGCGSCWAHAATSVLEAHMEANASIMKYLRKRLDSTGKTSSDESLSVKAVTHCTANPRNCGGNGGCSGATTELAFDMIQESGIPLDVEQEWSGDDHAVMCRESAQHETLVSITGYEVLPSNKLHPLIQALYESGGPIGVSVDATTWFGYHGGGAGGSCRTWGARTPRADSRSTTRSCSSATRCPRGLTTAALIQGTGTSRTRGDQVGARMGSSEWR